MRSFLVGDIWILHGNLQQLVYLHGAPRHHKTCSLYERRGKLDNRSQVRNQLMLSVKETSKCCCLIQSPRCVEERDKALALGFLAAVSGLFGFLPNPIIYGSLIDSSCLVWETSCGEKGSCWVYNTDEFRCYNDYDF